MAAWGLIVSSFLVFSSGFETFAHKEKDYSIEFPGSWILVEDFNQADVLARSAEEKSFPPNCNVIASLGHRPLEPTEFYERSFKEVKSIPGFVELQRGRLAMAKEPLAWIAFERNIYMQTYITHSYLLAKESNSFVITCIATQEDYRSYADLFHQIASSFRLSQK